MKIIKHNTYSKYLILLIILILTISACYQYPELDDIQYEDYRRIIGPEGGIINFYKNYENDSIKDVLVKMEFPEDALDDFIVFNMYEFFDEPTHHELDNMSLEQYSYFLYFVPFYESDGYNEHSQGDTNQHISINFNLPVTVTYNFSKYEYYVEEINNIDIAKLYRIKIPAENEWEMNNVWIRWNLQGYPDGYSDIDLIYLITGKWTESISWGTGELSLSNWEEVTEYTYNNIDQTVVFDINNTDYMYVMAYFMEI